MEENKKKRPLYTKGLKIFSKYTKNIVKTSKEPTERELRYCPKEII